MQEHTSPEIEKLNSFLRGERSAVEGLMQPALSAPLDAFPVSVRVNNVRNNGSELIEALPVDEAIPGTVGEDGFWPPPTGG